MVEVDAIDAYPGDIKDGMFVKNSIFESNLVMKNPVDIPILCNISGERTWKIFEP